MDSKHILVLGAGRSSGALINFLLENSIQHNYKVIVADADTQALQSRINGHPQGEARQIIAEDSKAIADLVRSSDLVISLLPPSLHAQVAQECLNFQKHFITASYVSPAIQAMDTEARQKGLSFIMECGLDPGIDHLSAKEIIDRIVEKGGRIQSFKSFTGGLVAPESDNNPWHYKITWNPRNVVLAGKGTAKFKRNNLYKYVPYHKLFTRLEHIVIPGYGDFEGYFNRDSLLYRSIYGLEDIPTIIRGTLRRPGFSSSWNCLVQLGLTDDSFMIEDLSKYTYRDFVNMFLIYKPNDTVEKKLAEYLGIDEQGPEMENLNWLGLFESHKIGLKEGTPADVIQHLLMQRLAFETGDKDMVVMQHQFEYQLDGKMKSLVSSMVLKGEKQGLSAMAKTVGWPLGIAALMVLNNQYKISGVSIPVQPELYKPMLTELKNLGINFLEEEFDH